jgi:hypothetical protein
MTTNARALTFPATRRLVSRFQTRWGAELLTLGMFGLAGLGAETLRGYANRTSIPRQSESVIRLDRIIGLGATPTERLQSIPWAGHSDAIAWSFLALHISWFVVPALLTVYIVFARRELAWSYAIARTGILYVSLVFFLLLPTEPPWMALHVHRVLEVAGKAPVNADWNTVAAFPSLHVAVPAVQALWLRRQGMRKLAATFAVYALLTALMAVYTGEHYVTDAIAGVALAYFMVRVSGWLSPVVRASASHPSPSAAEPVVGRRSDDATGLA